MPECPRIFASIFGTVAWGPLRCTGPITVEVETLAHVLHTYLPVFVEVVPFESEWEPACANLPGFVVLVAYGDQFSACGTWTRTYGPLDITSVVPLGSLYAVRIYSFEAGRRDWESPALDCIRITAYPESSGVSLKPWGAVKQLYK